MSTLDYTIIEDLDSKRILFLDTSNYSSSPISPTLHIKFPGFQKEYSTPIRFGEINIINTSMLKFSQYPTEFSDGVYEFRFEINNGKCEVKRKEFITTEAYYKLNKMLSEKDENEFNKYLLDKYYKINLYLHGAKASVCDEQKALSLYKQAENLLKC